MNIEISDPVQLYQQALLNANMGLWQFDFDTRILSWDEGFRKLYNLTEGSYSASVEAWFSFVPPEDQIQVAADFKKIMFGDSQVYIRFRYKISENQIKYIKCRCFKTSDKNSKKEIITGIHWDITAESLLEIELIKAKEFTEKILDAVPDPVFVKNEKLEVVYGNSAYEKLIGQKRESFLGKNDFEFLPRDQAEYCRKSDLETLNSSGSNEVEEVFVDHEGVRRIIMNKKTRCDASEGESILVGVIRDITDLKNIQNAMLEQSKMASLGEMAADIAHEINNPLAIIKGKSLILQDKIINNQIDLDCCKNDLKLIEVNSKRIDQIIASLRTVSRKSDQDVFDKTSVLKIIEESLNLSNDRFAKNKITLSSMIDKAIDHNHTVKARASEIIQVLLNLLNNSYDAVQEQKDAWVHVMLSASGDKYLIEVTDSGKEIPPEIASKMMEPFFTTKPQGKGTGLGLSISKQIIKNHQGELYYEPKDKRTRFVIALPKARLTKS